MSLSSIQLEAFLAVSRTQSFTVASKSLNITQSALSQRIKNLEDELGTTLFVRDPSGAKMTEFGQKLLRFCQAREGLEIEFLEAFKTKNPGELRGTLKIAGYSSINHSIVIPALQPLLTKHEHLQLDLMTAELFEIPQFLSSARADFVFTNEPIARQGLVTQLLGFERNVVIESKARKGSPSVYLDQHEKDVATYDYFKFHGRDLPKDFRRSFVGNIDSILTGVRLGLGRAIAPKHLITRGSGVEIVKGFAEQKVPVYLSYFEQPYYTDLHKVAAKTLGEKLSEALKNGPA